MLRQATQKTPITALYARLSKDDEQQGESLSIENQKRILETYARDNGFLNCRFFVDDGWSGANFQRPGFMEMMDCVENGEVKCVITKDLSRMGRNYLQVGMFTEITFPKKGVRFIAINDGVDSAQGDNDLTPLKNLFNEWMVRDTSRKIKAVFRSKGMSGKPLTSQPVYGYLKGEDGHFIIDEEAAPVVRQIFSLCLAGNGPTKIARVLTEQEIPTPGTLEYRRTGSTRRYYPDYPYKWATNTIVHILERKEYLGHTVNFKTEKISYKVKSSVENPEEKQVVFENTHEPIIDPATWERVQELRKHRRRPTKSGIVSPFSGLLYCADCGEKLYYSFSNNSKREQAYFFCSSYRKNSDICSTHYIREKVVEQLVLESMQRIMLNVQVFEKEFARKQMACYTEEKKKQLAAKRRELEKAQKRIAEIDTLIQKIYEDNASGKLSDERHMTLSTSYEAEQQMLKAAVPEMQAYLETETDKTVNLQQFIRKVKKITELKVLTPELIHEFVEKIVVYAPKYLDGKRIQTVDTYYSAVGILDELTPKEMEEVFQKSLAERKKTETA